MKSITLFLNIMLFFRLPTISFAEEKNIIDPSLCENINSSKSVVSNTFIGTDTTDYNLPIDSSTNSNRRYIFLTTGFGEFLSFGIGFDFFNWSVAIKLSNFIVEGGFILPNYSLGGVGFKIARVFDKPLLKHFILNLDNISFESSFGHDAEKNDLYTARFLSLLIGSENRNKHGFNFLWGIGVGASKIRNRNWLLLPSLKLGLIYNI